MKLLLTSAGIKNASIQDALVEMLGRPIAECNALCNSTASYGHPHGRAQRAWEFVSGRESETPMCELGWKSLGVLELTALPSIERAGQQWVRDADVLLVNGGDALYLCHWMRESGLADLLPSLQAMVWVGLSAGSMVMTPRIGEDFVQWKPQSGGDETLGFVEFSIFPHLDNPGLPVEYDGRCRTVGCRYRVRGLRDRRPDRDQVRRRCRRGRLGGAVEVVPPVRLQPICSLRPMRMPSGPRM